MRCCHLVPNLVAFTTDMMWSWGAVRRRETVLVALVVMYGLGVLHLMPRVPPAAAEGLLIAALLHVLAASRQAREAVQRMALPQRLVAAILVGVVLVGHFHARAHDTFPFVEWDIYAQTLHGNPRFFDYYATRHDGAEEHLIPAEVIPALGKKLTVQLEQVADAIEAAGDLQRRAELVRWYEGLLLALARADNRQHAGDPVAAIRIEKCTVPLERYAGWESIACEPFWFWKSVRDLE